MGPIESFQLQKLLTQRRSSRIIKLIEMTGKFVLFPKNLFTLCTETHPTEHTVTLKQKTKTVMCNEIGTASKCTVDQ